VVLLEFDDFRSGGRRATYEELEQLLTPVPGRVRLDQGAAEGWVVLPTRRGLRPVRRHRSERRVLDVISEDRAR